jgi:hypothetical protein
MPSPSDRIKQEQAIGFCRILIQMRSLLLLPLTFSSLQASPTAPTFYKDVLPVLQKHCQTCHRPGEAAPMSLLAYKEVRPFAAAIREAVQLRKMPPWGADPAHGKFANDPSLSEKEKQILIDWAAARAPEGDPGDASQPLEFTEGWNIGRPDAVFEMPKPYAIPAKGVVDYTYYVIPLHFNEDRWVQAAEFRPGNRALVHHVIGYIRASDSEWLSDAKVGEPYTPKEPFDQVNHPKGWGEFLIGYAPGYRDARFAPGQAKLIKAGSDLVFEVHYTASGTAGTDLTRLGVVFAKEPPKERVMTIGAANGEFVIPPGAANYPVNSEITFYGEAKILAYAPHMHVRGKSFRYDLVRADGTRETLLNVPRYDFQWQHHYQPAEPLRVRDGMKIECFATFDNSPNNPWNPDPKKEVRWGDQSWEEMMVGFMEVAFDAKTSPEEIFVAPKDRSQSTKSSR